MLTAEQIVGLVVFLGAFGVVYAGAGVAAFHALHRWRTKQSSPVRTRTRRTLRVIFLAMAGIGILCMAYGFFIEPYWLEVTHPTVATAKLPRGSKPIRIVQISDLHSVGKVRLEDDLPNVVAGLTPDLIVFTGDAANTDAGVRVFRASLTRLAKIAPTFAVRGNWDPIEFDLFRGTGVRELCGEALRLDLGGRELWLAGAKADDEAGLLKALSAIPAGRLTVALYHYPDAIEMVAKMHRADLLLAGHTHGGQVAMPFYGAILTMSRTGKKYERGLYRVEDTSLYVNRGLGMGGRITPLLRFLSRPEVTLVELTPQP